MREMLREDYGKSSSKISSGNQEVTDYDMMNDIITASLSDDWEPGQVKMSVEDHKNVINELSKLEVKNNDDQVQLHHSYVHVIENQQNRVNKRRKNSDKHAQLHVITTNDLHEVYNNFYDSVILNQLTRKKTIPHNLSAKLAGKFPFKEAVVFTGKDVYGQLISRALENKTLKQEKDQDFHNKINNGLIFID